MGTSKGASNDRGAFLSLRPLPGLARTALGYPQRSHRAAADSIEWFGCAGGWMMPRSPCTFRQRDVTAALKATAAAGMPVHGVKISAEGVIEIVIGLPVDHDSAADRNEWDDLLDGGHQAEIR
jgi:hypothetical protein